MQDKTVDYLKQLFHQFEVSTNGIWDRMDELHKTVRSLRKLLERL